MADGDQLSFGDGLLSNRRKISKLSKHLAKLDEIIDWQPLVREISILDKTDKKTGGRPSQIFSPPLRLVLRSTGQGQTQSAALRLPEKTKPKAEQRSGSRGTFVCVDEDQGESCRHAS